MIETFLPTICDKCKQEIIKCEDCGRLIRRDERAITINREDFDTNPHTFSRIYQCMDCWGEDEESWNTGNRV